MERFNVQSLNESFNVSGPDYICIDTDDCEIISPSIQWYQEMNISNPNKDRIWITNGTDNKMIKDEEIPEGWYKGRTFKFSKEGRAANLKQLRDSNPNAKKYRIKYRDGTEEIVTQLSTWARNKGHAYSSIKHIVHRTKYKKNEFFCYNSPTYYIEGIYKL